MKDRLLQFLQVEKLTPAQFANTLGVQRSGISHILAGRNRPGFDFIEKMLLAYPGLNARWLITGKGKMYAEAGAPEEANVPPERVVPGVLPFPVTERAVEKIVILFSDKSFCEYIPQND